MNHKLMPTVEETQRAFSDFHRIMTTDECVDRKRGITYNVVMYAINMGYVIAYKRGTRLLISRSSWKAYLEKRDKYTLID